MDRPRKALLDTNLLLLLVVGSVNSAAIAQFKRTNCFTKENFNCLNDYVARSAGIVVTPHILTEVANLLHHAKEPLREPGMRYLASAIEKWEERQFSSKTLAGDPDFGRLGLTDIAIMRAALEDKEIEVLTGDLELCHSLGKRKLRVVNVHHQWFAP